MKVVVGSNDKISKLIAEDFINVVNKKENAVLGLATGTSPLKVYADLAKATFGLLGYAMLFLRQVRGVHYADTVRKNV